MSNSSTSSPPGNAHTIRKFLLSFFVVFTFIAYAVRNQLDATDVNATRVPTTLPLLAQQPDSMIMSVSTAVPTRSLKPTSSNSVSAPLSAPTITPNLEPTDVPTDLPTSTPVQVPTPTPDGLYKDGTYVGPIVDAYYGNVQVEAVVQGGKLADVQFLDYPQDRRTSRYINQQAMPWLTQEAIQFQTARVDLISGATFTSQAFVMSLQSALEQAHV